ncbi:MAG TPA: ATP-binding protein [Micromonosporaceae bacterium]
MTGLTGVVRNDPDTGTTEVTLSGPLNVRTVRPARLILQKSLAEHPITVLVDLNGVTVESDMALWVLPAMARQAADGTVILVYVAAASETGRLVRRVLDRTLPIHEDRPAALAAMLDHPATRRRIHGRYPPEVRSAGAARTLARDACERWALEGLRDDAQLIVSELVTNAIEHAGTAVDVTLVLLPPYLHIQVRDGSSAPPAFPVGAPRTVNRTTRGRGLQMITMLASGWGTTIRAYGKTVWATLRVGRPG